MPEEINRVLVDRVSSLLLLPDDSNVVSSNSLQDARLDAKRVVVGNVMMDQLRWTLRRLPAARSPVAPHQPYAVLTVHRPANVDTPLDFERVRATVRASPYPIIWPCHPRASRYDLDGRVQRIDPLGYRDMIWLVRDAAMVITDSGGLLEEALYLGKSVVSLRDSSKNERQHLIERGVPEIWRTDAAPRIVDALLEGA